MGEPVRVYSADMRDAASNIALDLARANHAIRTISYVLVDGSGGDPEFWDRRKRAHKLAMDNARAAMSSIRDDIANGAYASLFKHEPANEKYVLAIRGIASVVLLQLDSGTFGRREREYAVEQFDNQIGTLIQWVWAIGPE